MHSQHIFLAACGCIVQKSRHLLQLFVTWPHIWQSVSKKSSPSPATHMVKAAHRIILLVCPSSLFPYSSENAFSSGSILLVRLASFSGCVAEFVSSALFSNGAFHPIFHIPEVALLALRGSGYVHLTQVSEDVYRFVCCISFASLFRERSGADDTEWTSLVDAEGWRSDETTCVVPIECMMWAAWDIFIAVMPPGS